MHREYRVGDRTAYSRHMKTLSDRVVISTEEGQELRPVHVLTIEDPVLNGGRQRPSKEPLMKGLSDTIRLAGYTAEEAHVDDVGPQWLWFEFEKNRSWKDLPIIARPNIYYEEYMIGALDGNGHRIPVRTEIAGRHGKIRRPLAEIMRERVKVIVVACFDYRDEYVFRCLAAFTHVSDRDLPTVLVHTPDGGWIVERTDVIRIMNRFTPEARFVYNHAVNFSILARRALFAVAHEENLHRHVAAKMLPSVWTYHWEWAHPLFLQTLFLLRREGRIGSNSHRVMLERSAQPYVCSPIYARGLPIFEPKGENYELVWKGTGVYPELRMDIGRIDDRVENPSASYEAFFEHYILRCFMHAGSMGLLGLADGQIVLSPWGVRFLEIIGSEMEDPDALLRWRSATGELGKPDDIKAMDRWLNRGFRAMKRRVASFQDKLSLLSEEGRIETDNKRDRYLSVFGTYIPLDAADFSDLAVVADLVAIAKAEVPEDFKDARCGIVYDHARLDHAAQAIGVWYGVPLAARTGDVMRAWEPGWLKDMSAIEEEARRALALMPESLLGRSIGTVPEVVHGLPTLEEGNYMPLLPWAVASSATDTLSIIVKGVVSTLDQTRDLPLGTRRYLSIPNHRKRGSDPFYFGGLYWTGKESGFKTVACGLYVGILNETTDRWHINPRVSKQRLEAFEEQRSSLMANAHPCFHLNLSGEGYWALLADGTARKIDYVDT